MDNSQLRTFLLVIFISFVIFLLVGNSIIFQNSQNSPKLDTPVVKYIDIKGKGRCFKDSSFKYLNISEV